MKRLVWLVLAVFAALLTRVEPADMPEAKAPACCCGGCDMPECPPPPANSPAPVLTLLTPVQATASVTRRVAAPRVRQEKLFVRIESQRAARSALRTAIAVARPASVPLFAAHCSFLI